MSMPIQFPGFAMRQAAALIALSCFLALAARGQQTVLGTTQERETTLPNGFHLNEVDISGSYSSITGGLEGLLGPNILALEGFSGAVAVTTSYTNRGPFSNFSILYTPSFVDLFHFSKHFWGQALAVNLDERLGTHWTVRLSGTGRLESAQEFLFLPQGSVDTSASPIDSGYSPTLLLSGPGLLFGTRILTFNANAKATYSPTERVHISLEGQGSEILSRPDEGAPEVAVVPRARLAGGVLSADFNVSPRTNFGADAYFQEGWTTFGRYDTANVGLHLGRKLGRHWLVSTFGGYSWITSVGDTNFKNVGTISATGKIAYQARQSSWTVAYHRQAGDGYGFGAAVTDGYSTTYDWHSLNRLWAIQVTGDRSQLAGGASPGIDLWDAGFTVSRSLGRKIALGAGGSYLRESLAQGAQGQAKVYSARVTLSWIPFLRDTLPLGGPPSQVDQDQTQKTMGRTQ